MDRDYLWDHVPGLIVALTNFLMAEQKIKGNVWHQLPRQGQEERIFKDFYGCLQKFREKQTPIPWLKIIGLALVGWVRETKNI